MAPPHIAARSNRLSRLPDLRAALRAAEEMVQAVDAAIWVADVTTLHVYSLTHGTERLLGYPADPSLVDQDFLRHHIHPSDRGRVLREIRACIDSAMPIRLEYRGVTADGQVVRLRNHVRVVADPAGYSRRLLGLIVDVTSPGSPPPTPRPPDCAAEALLRQLPTAAALLDSSLVVRDANETFARRLGVSLADLAGRSAEGSLPEDVCAALTRACETREECVLEASPTQPAEGSAGEGAGQRWRVVPIVGDQGACEGIVLSLSDPVETGPGPPRAEAPAAEPEDADAARERFLATVAHELRNPLTSMLTALEVVRAGVLENKAVARAMGVLERSVHLQSRLVEDLMHFSAAATGQLRLRPGPIELHTVVAAAVDTERPNAENASLTLQVDLDPGLWVDGDADRLQQAAANLVGNAVKYTAPGGEVRVRLHRVEAEPPDTAPEAVRDAALDEGYQAATRKGRRRPPAEAAPPESPAPSGEPDTPTPPHPYAPTRGRAYLVVEDTGMGISPELLPRLFDVFQRGEDAARAQPGLGIGLALVRSIAEMHGGRVWVESEGLGKGSRFTLALPLIQPPA